MRRYAARRSRARPRTSSHHAARELLTRRAAPPARRWRRPGSVSARVVDVVVGDRRRGVGEMRGQRHAGDERHFEGAHQALLVARLDPRRRRRIEPRHPAMQLLGAVARRDGVEARAQRDRAASARERCRGSARGSRGRCRRRGSAAARGAVIVADDRRRPRSRSAPPNTTRSGGTRSTMWCGMPRCSSTGTLSVPMSKRW